MAMIDPLYSLSGFAVGMLVGMTGVGGGSLMTPLLILLFGVHPATAVGTDLLYAAATKTGGSLVHGFARSIDWRVVRRLASGSIPATVVTLAALSSLNLNGEAAREPDHAGAQRRAVRDRRCAGVRRADHRRSIARASASSIRRARRSSPCWSGVLLGVLVSISSVGAGAIGVVRAGAALSAIADGQDRRLRHRACGAADAARRPRPLDDGLGRLAHHRLAAGRLAARHFRRQLLRHPHSRARAALVLAATLFVVASRIAYDHATAASSIFTAFTRPRGA